LEPAKGRSAKDAVTIIYEPHSGAITIDAGDLICRAIELKSERNIFVGELPEFLKDGPFNVCIPQMVFLLDRNGLPNPLRLQVLPKGLQFEDISQAILVKGSLIFLDRPKKVDKAYLLIESGRVARRFTSAATTGSRPGDSRRWPTLLDLESP
jgi:hypothetical protein